jgi:riboflavin biosynthesis pyrimidine reductase
MSTTHHGTIFCGINDDQLGDEKKTKEWISHPHHHHHHHQVKSICPTVMITTATATATATATTIAEKD